MGGDGPDESARTLGSGGYHSVQDCASSVVRSVVGVSLRILEELQSQPKAHGAASFASMGIRLDRAFVVSEAVRKVRSTADRNTGITVWEIIHGTDSNAFLSKIVAFSLVHRCDILVGNNRRLGHVF